MKTHLETLDNFCANCGYFNNQTPINNFYGCNHPDCQDKYLVRVVQDYSGEFNQEEIEEDETMAIRSKLQGRICHKHKDLKEIYNSDKIYKRYIDKMNETPFADVFLKDAGLKLQGACFSWSCPIAYEADDQDFIKHGENPERMTVGLWMVMSD